MDALYTKEWIHDGRILRYGFHEPSRAAVDAWSTDLPDVLRTWRNDKPLLLLIDVRMNGAFVSSPKR